MPSKGEITHEPLQQLVKNALSIEQNSWFFALFTDENNKKLVVQLNLENQLKYGIMPDGDVLPHYSRTSQEQFGKPNAPIMLYDTGAFYETFNVSKVTKDSFEINANPNKTEFGYTVNLFDIYGDATGLTDESLAILQDKILPQLQDYIYEQLTLNL